MKKMFLFVIKVMTASLLAVVIFFLIDNTEQASVLLFGVCLTVFAVMMRRRLNKVYDEPKETASV